MLSSLSEKERTSIDYGRLAVVLVVGLIIASSWLVFPYLVKGERLLQTAGDESRLLKSGSVARYFHRRLIHHPDLEISATFATTEFFQYVDDLGMVKQLRPDRHLIFFVNEAIHEGELPTELPRVELNVDGSVYQSVESSGPLEAEHHRLSVYSFPKRSSNGDVIEIDKVESIKLRVSGNWVQDVKTLSFVGEWEAPFDLPEELKTGSSITLLAMMALGAGLLSSVLTPCLIQLVVVFGSIIGGFSTLPAEGDGSSKLALSIIRRKIMQVACCFVFGFTFLYLLAGAVIGAVGHQAQLLFSEYSRTVSIVAGSFVILLGLWVGVRGFRPQACKMIDVEGLRSLALRDNAGALLISMGYALGCTACFGGAIVGTLIIYVGSIGSASIGAGIMFVFSVGVAIPFLLASWYFSRMDSLLVFLSRKSHLVSLICMVSIVLFGTILVTDNFHTVSDAIYPYLGLT